MKSEESGETDYLYAGKRFVLQRNVSNLRYLSICLLLYGALSLISCQWMKEKYPGNIRLLYLCLLTFLLLIGAVSLMLMRGGRRHIQRNALFFEKYINGVLFLVMMLGSMLTLLDQMVYGQITAFTVNYVLCAALLLTEPPVFRKLQAVPLLVLFLFLPVLQKEFDLVITDYVTLTVVGVCMNFVNHWNYLTFCKTETSRLKIGRLADKDELTGLNNRRKMRVFIEETVRKKSAVHSIGIIMFDIDYFKKYNDFYGHAMGDMVLTSIGAVVRELSEQYGAFSARYGGEEFIVILKNRTLEEVSAMAGDIKKSIADLGIDNKSLGYSGKISVSIGQYWTKRISSDLDISELIKKADAALYNAKRSGRNRICRNSA